MMAKSKDPPEGQDPLPPDVATPATADWDTMGRLDTVINTALQKYLTDRIRRKNGGVDLVTMFMFAHNWHVRMLMELAAQIAPTNPLGRKAFYMNARDTFVKRMNTLIKEMEELLLSSAISEAESMRARKDGPN